MEIIFLTLDEVLQIHRDQIDRYGGMHGIRDLHLLQSAISMPQAGFGDQYLHESIFAMAAAYLFHITQYHPFLDGNKRTGLASALVFLELNNIAIEIDDALLEKTVRQVAEGKIGKDKLTEIFKNTVFSYEQ
jgi:death-on-curing protein